MPTIKKTIKSSYQGWLTTTKIEFVFTRAQEKAYKAAKKKAATIRGKIKRAEKSGKPTKRLKKSLETAIKKIEAIESKARFKEVTKTDKIRTVNGGYVTRRKTTHIEKRVNTRARYITGRYKVQVAVFVNIVTNSSRVIEAGSTSWLYVDSDGDINKALEKELHVSSESYKILNITQIFDK